MRSLNELGRAAGSVDETVSTGALLEATVCSKNKGLVAILVFLLFFPGGALVAFG